MENDVKPGKVNPMVRLELDVEIPMDYNPTESDVKEWIEYWTGNRRYIARENPLCYLGIKGKILKYEPNAKPDLPCAGTSHG